LNIRNGSLSAKKYFYFIVSYVNVVILTVNYLLLWCVSPFIGGDSDVVCVCVHTSHH